MSTFTSVETFVVVHCCNCGVAFGIEKELQRRLLAKPEWFYCTNGHRQYYGGPSEAQRLQTELDAEKRRTARAEEREKRAREERIRVEHQLRTVKGHQTRLKKRIAGGACPCCNRTFQNLARHMSHQHPDFAAVAG